MIAPPTLKCSFQWAPRTYYSTDFSPPSLNTPSTWFLFIFPTFKYWIIFGLFLALSLSICSNLLVISPSFVALNAIYVLMTHTFPCPTQIVFLKNNLIGIAVSLIALPQYLISISNLIGLNELLIFFLHPQQFSSQIFLQEMAIMFFQLLKDKHFSVRVNFHSFY